MENTGIIILAAGASKRLGSPKQQLVFQKQMLLQRIIDTSLQTRCRPVVVVLGAYADDIRKDITASNIHLALNTNWESGMASSIHTGIRELLRITDTINGAFILVCDQPFITPQLLHELMSARLTTGKEIIACCYNDILGTPVLFSRAFFPQLMALSGQEGAKKLLLKYTAITATVSFPQGAIDIDTPEDYKNLL
ncbi:MAG TPA: nucleotidyltransferase family protein [Chitinophaga sp.]|uniref:nucleotidyltransferase family protein n=1 Tax=Chitinophaga sp. TaxID=1869181 RepID=UPI002C06F408|nr:nucleotidyltransferase family protein [Chitinophaga sp.]HVI47658.1 nucleotidyltransferase family protein [Chitinophaga sp.]